MSQPYQANDHVFVCTGNESDQPRSAYVIEVRKSKALVEFEDGTQAWVPCSKLC